MDRGVRCTVCGGVGKKFDSALRLVRCSPCRGRGWFFLLARPVDPAAFEARGSSPFYGHPRAQA